MESCLSLKNITYDRFCSSKNCKESPCSVELWLLDSKAIPIHNRHCERLAAIMSCIYLWKAEEWSQILTNIESNDYKDLVLRIKSDFYCAFICYSFICYVIFYQFFQLNNLGESLAQHVAELVFDEKMTDSVYLYGPTCAATNCQCIPDASKLIIRTTIDGGTDNLNPCGRKLTCTFEKSRMFYPEISIEVFVPVELKILFSTYNEVLDFRPRIQNRRDSHQTYVLRAHIPPLRRRTKNIDFPDFCLFYIPCRHLVFQGHVNDPKRIGEDDGIQYDSLTSCLDRFQAVMEKLRCRPGSEEVAKDIAPFISADYYYAYITKEGFSNAKRPQNLSGSVFHCVSSHPLHSTPSSDDDDEDEEEEERIDGLPHFCLESFELDEFRDYIVGTSFGVARGLAADFDSVALIVDGIHTRTVCF